MLSALDPVSPAMRTAVCAPVCRRPCNWSAISLVTRPAVPVVSCAAFTAFSASVLAVFCSCSRMEVPVVPMLMGRALPRREPNALPSEGTLFARELTVLETLFAKELPRSLITFEMLSVPTLPMEGIRSVTLLSAVPSTSVPFSREAGAVNRSLRLLVPCESREDKRLDPLLPRPDRRFMPEPRKF